MKKPSSEVFEKFAVKFKAASKKAGLEQYLVPYFIASHPGSGLNEMIELALFLKKNGYRPLQINDFIPAPMEIATAAYHTGLDPYTLAPIHVPKGESERRMQRALLQYFKPENRLLVIKALKTAGRMDVLEILLGAKYEARGLRK